MSQADWAYVYPKFVIDTFYENLLEPNLQLVAKRKQFFLILYFQLKKDKFRGSCAESRMQLIPYMVLILIIVNSWR